MTGLDTGQILRRMALFASFGALGIVALATLPGVGEVRARVASAEAAWIAVAALCSLGSMLGFVVALWGVFDRVVPRRAVIDLGFAEQGANVLLPAGGTGGPAAGTLLMRRAGVPVELAAQRHTALFLVTSAVSSGALVVFGFSEAIGLLPGREPLTLTLVPALVGVAEIGIAIRFARSGLPEEPAPERRVRHAGWRLRRFLHGGARTSIELLRHGDPLFAAGAVTYFAFDVAALAAAFQAFGGGGPPLGVFVLAYTIGHAGALIPTPGGVGGTDGGLIASFALFGAPLGLATAGVLGYRVFQLGLPVVLGAGGLVRIQHRLGDESQRAAVARRFAHIR